MKLNKRIADMYKCSPAVRSLAISIAVLFATTGCGRRPEAASPKASAAPVSIAYSRLRISLPIFVAQQKGYFIAHNLQIDLRGYVTAQPMMQALAEGKLDLAGYTALPITFNAIERSNNPLYFTTLMLEDQQHPITFLLRRKIPAGGRPTIKVIHDLKGKKIGILPTIAYKSWLGLVLKANGLDPIRDVVVQPIAPELEVAALKNGGIDALFSNDPMITAAIATGAGEVISNEAICPQYIENPLPFGSFNVRKEWADRNSETLKAVEAALDEAIQFINAHPDEANEMMKPYIGEDFKNQVGLYPHARYLSSKNADAAWFLKEARFELQLGIIPRALDLQGMILNGGE